MLGIRSNSIDKDYERQGELVVKKPEPVVEATWEQYLAKEKERKAMREKRLKEKEEALYKEKLGNTILKSPTRKQAQVTKLDGNFRFEDL